MRILCRVTMLKLQAPEVVAGELKILDSPDKIGHTNHQEPKPEELAEDTPFELDPSARGKPYWQTIRPVCDVS